MTRFVAALNHPVDVADGRTLAPGEAITDLDLDDPHNAALVEDGALLETEDAVEAEPEPEVTDVTEPEPEQAKTEEPEQAKKPAQQKKTNNSKGAGK